MKGGWGTRETSRVGEKEKEKGKEFGDLVTFFFFGLSSLLLLLLNCAINICMSQWKLFPDLWRREITDLID